MHERCNSVWEPALDPPFPLRWSSAGPPLSLRSRGFLPGSVRTEPGHPLRMSKQPRGLQAVLKDLAQSPEHSPLFWYMLEHHAAMLEATGGRRVRWSPSLLAKLAALGLTDGEGKPPSMESARRTWRHVRAELAAQRSYQLTGVKPKRQQPSRMPATWQPPVAQPQPLASAPQPAPAHDSLLASTTDSDDPPPGSWEYVRRQLAKMSGR